VLDVVDQAAGGSGKVRFFTLCGPKPPSAAFSSADFGASAVSLDDLVDDPVSGVTRSSASVMVSPLLRKAISCSRRATVSKSYVVVSNTVASAPETGPSSRSSCWLRPV